MRQIPSGVLCVLILTAFATPARADVVTEQYMRSGGFAGMGGFESAVVTTTSASAQREESRFRFTGSLLGPMQRMMGSGDTVRITRLDKDVVWELDVEKKMYTESPLTPKAERERQGPAAGSRPKEKAEPSDVVVTRSEFKVEKTGARKVINGFPCEEYLATWLLETRNQKTGETTKSTMTARLWTTPETVEIRAAHAEAQAYMQAYLKKLGFAMSPEEARRFGIGAMVGATGLSETEQERALARFAAEMAKIQGYPIVTEVDWNMEGSGGGEARERPAPGGGGAQPGLGELMGQLGKLLGGGGQKPAAESQRPEGEGPAPLFNMHMEVKSLKVTPPQPAQYEIPVGFTRK